MSAFKSAKIGKIWAKPGAAEPVKPSRKNKKKAAGNDQETELEKVMKEVSKLGGAELRGKARKQWELNQLVEMGAKVPKNPKVPFPILLGMRQKQMKRDEKLRQSAKDGFLLPQAISKRALPGSASVSAPRLIKTKRERDQLSQKVLRPKTGKIQNGMLVLSKREIRSVKYENKPLSKRPQSSGSSKRLQPSSGIKRQRR